MRAAVFYEPGQPLVIEDVDIRPPEKDEVLVRLAASGVCHSDYRVVLGEWRRARPMVLGHEGAGIIDEVGPEVRNLEVGDHVILSWTPNCGRCFYCVSGQPQLCRPEKSTASSQVVDDRAPTPRSLRRSPLHAFAAIGSFAEYSVIRESAAIRIRRDMPLDKAALIGCAITTGVGAAVNTARIPAGASVLVVGCGAVGLSIIQGAVLSSAREIIAADIHDGKLIWARRFGATRTVNTRHDDLLSEVRAATQDRGVDYAFEAVGSPATIEQAYESIRPGGKAVVVGQTPDGQRISLDPYILSDHEKTLTGSNYGSASPSIDFPRLVDLYLTGRLHLDEMISQTVPLDAVNDAFQQMAAGETLRTVLALV